MALKSSIGRKHLGRVSIREYQRDHFAAISENNGATRVIQEIMSRTEEGFSTGSGSELFAHSHRLVSTMYQSHATLKVTGEELAKLVQRLKYADEVFKSLNDNSPGAIGLGEEAKHIIELIKEGTALVVEMVGTEGSLAIANHRILTTRNLELETQVEQLKGEQMICKEVLYQNHKIRDSRFKDIGDINLPEYFTTSEDLPSQAVGTLLQHKDAIAKALSETNEQLKSRCAEMERSDKRGEEERTRLIRETEKQREEIEHLKSVAGEATTALTVRTEGEHNFLKAQLQRATEELTENQNRIEQERKCAEEAEAQCNEDRTSLRERGRMLESLCDQMKQTIAELKIKADNDKLLKQQLQIRVDQADKTVTDNRAREATHVDSIRKESQRAQESDKRFAEEKIQRAEERADRAEQEIADLKERLEELKTSTDLSKTVINQYEKEKKTLEEQLTIADEKGKDLETKYESAMTISRSERDELVTEKNDLAEKVDAALQEISDMSTRINECEKSKTELKVDLDAGKQQRSQLEQKCQKLQDRITEYETVEEGWRKQVDLKRKYKAHLRRATQRAWDLHRVVEDCKEALEQKDDEIKELNHEMLAMGEDVSLELPERAEELGI